MESEAISIIGGAAGICAFVLAMMKVYTTDKIWRDLIGEVRGELAQCRTDKGTLESKVNTLEGEVMQLRREINTDRWLGIDPQQTRPQQHLVHDPQTKEEQQ